MRFTTTRGSTLLLAAIVVSSLAVLPLASEPVAAEEPETADDYFETFRALEGTEAFEEYDELETVRTFAVTRAQEMGEVDAEDRRAFDATLETMDAFETAYEAVENDEYKQALEAANETERTIERLANYDESQATLAQLALTRFYETNGGELETFADEADRTPEEIEWLSLAATAYERAEITDEAAEFNQQVEQRRSEYERDLAAIDAAENGSATFLERCADCTEVSGAISGDVVGIFGEYGAAQEQYREIIDAEQRAAAHGLEEREETLAETGDELAESRMALAIVSVSMLVGYGVLTGLFATVVISQIFVWRRTYEAAQVGSVVQIGDNNV